MSVSSDLNKKAAKPKPTPQEWGYKLIKRCAEFKPYLKTTLEMIEKADLSQRDEWGQTALMMCASHNHHEIAKILIDKKVDLNIQTPKSLTSALSWGTQHNATATVLMMIAAGANVDIQNAEGETPLHIAVTAGNETITAALIAAGADINIRDTRGRTPIYLVTTSAHGDPGVTNCAKMLLDARADIDIPTLKGELPEEHILKNHIRDNELRYPGIAAMLTAARDQKHQAIANKSLSPTMAPIRKMMPKTPR